MAGAVQYGQQLFGSIMHGAAHPARRCRASRLLSCAAEDAISANLRLASQSSEKVIDSIQARSSEAENLKLVTPREPAQVQAGRLHS